MYDKRLDSHSKFETIHNDDLGPEMGRFMDTSIRPWIPFDSAIFDTALRLERISASKGPGVLAEILPGEVLCADHVIRRETAAADRPIVGIQEALTSSGSQCRRVTLEEAEKLAKQGATIVWRPEGTIQDGHYALEVTT